MVRASYLKVVFCQAFAAAATLASLRWLAVYVDPETFGQYALYQSVVSAGALLLVNWPNAALLRFGREEWAAHGRIGATLAARIALFSTSLAVAIVLAWLLDPWLRTFLHVERPPFVFIALGIAVTPTAELAVYMNQAVGRTEMYGYAPLVTRAGFLLGVLLIPMLGVRAQWTYLALCIAASTGVAAMIAVAALPRTSYANFKLDAERLMSLLRYSWTLPFAGISTYVVNWVDSWVIRDVKGVGSVGVYNWAYQTTVIATLAFAPIAVVLTPRVIDARVNGDRVNLQRYVDAILPTALLTATAIAISLFFVLPILRYVAAASYAPAYPVILILLAALPFQLIAYLITPLGNAYERVLPRFVMVSAGIAVLNTIGDLLLVPRIGISGAAIATTSSFAIGALLLVMAVGTAGIQFAPVWWYVSPGLILLPAVALVLSAGAVGGAAIGLAAAAFVLFIVFYPRRRNRTLIRDIRSLPSALTMTNAAVAATPARAE